MKINVKKGYVTEQAGSTKFQSKAARPELKASFDESVNTLKKTTYVRSTRGESRADK